MKNYFQKQFTFNNWANVKFIEFIKKNNIENELLLKILSHIISVEELWLERLKNSTNYLIDTWEIFSIQEIEVLSKNNFLNWQKFIKRENTKKFSSKMCTYRNNEGKECNNLQTDIIQNVLIHSAYHRGQLNFKLKLLKFEPIRSGYTDFLN